MLFFCEPFIFMYVQIGRLGPHRSADDPNHWQTCNNSDTKIQHHPRQSSHMDLDHQGCALRRQGILHVSGQHRSHDITNWSSGCSRYEEDSFRRIIFIHHSLIVPPTIIDEESSPSTVSVREKHNASLICKSTGVSKVHLPVQLFFF